MKKNKNEDVEHLAKRIKALRNDQGYASAEHFAFDKFIARSQYIRYEKGQDLRFTSLVKLVNAFGISLEEFFRGFEDMSEAGKY